jgi:fermentation-respiration switch protein FrsA (DUF1100 family)
VKEQGPGVYAQELARRGFIAIGFDPSCNGESGGEPRHITSPELFAEDFSAGVDFLGTLPYIDRERIGAVGICGSGGFALSAAQADPRIKAVATAAMYDISGVKRNGWLNNGTDEDRRTTLAGITAQRWADVDAGEPALLPTFPSQIPVEGLDPITSEFFEYYVADRGHHPRSIGGFTITSDAAHINFGELRLSDIAPRPILLITGYQAHSRYFSDDVHEKATGPKELVVVPGARHMTSTTAPTSSPSTPSRRSSPRTSRSNPTRQRPSRWRSSSAGKRSRTCPGSSRTAGRLDRTR